MTEPLPITLVAALDGTGLTRQSLARGASAGALHRVSRGAYLDAAHWAAADDRTRHLARVDAVAGLGLTPVIASHWSAAAVHGLPILGRWPELVDTISPPGAGGRSTARSRIHESHSWDAHVVTVDGRRATSLARTLVDIAAAAPFERAVAMIDHALFVDLFNRARTPVTRRELLEVLSGMLPFRGHARARRALAFGATGAQTPIESVSRVTMWRVGCPRPELQHPFSDHAGFIGASDFRWRSSRLAGEADGDTKYLDASARGGRSVEQVLLDEKRREDRIRAQGDSVVRWGWRVARDERLLRDHLERAGLTMGSRWEFG